ncbi:hypothetical protein F5Y19DRAFT_413153 [Xylariaceae sp. FL1651]|nr:hypothetical protein F5Y19DRAFT_413153 [Xylariaceae sp. FL1651]
MSDLPPAGPSLPGRAPPTPSYFGINDQKFIDEFNALTSKIELATEAAQHCYESRQAFDQATGAFTPRDHQVHSDAAIITTHWQTVREEAVELLLEREKLRWKLDGEPYKLENDKARDGLEAVLLGIEQQKLLGMLATIGHIDPELVRLQLDMRDIRNETARREMGSALARVIDALMGFQVAFDQYGGPRLDAVHESLVRLGRTEQNEQDCKQGGPQTEFQFPKWDDEVDETDLTTNSTSDISSLSLGSPIFPVGVEKPETPPPSSNGSINSVFRFDPDDPPTLEDIAQWLGVNDVVNAALLMHSEPIKRAFATYRASIASSPYPGSAPDIGNPSRFRYVLPLFTYSREVLLRWQGVQSPTLSDPVDFGAALFANKVLRFCQGPSCAYLDWKPLSDLGLENFEIARRRWAIMLQILVFLEKMWPNMR